MTKRKNIFTTELLLCARKYSIINRDGEVRLPQIHISFMTEEGFFAAPIPNGISYEKFKEYEGYAIHELPHATEDVFPAGRIEKCTPNGFYGRFYKDCIHRANSERMFLYKAKSSKWIEMRKVGIWTYDHRAIELVNKAEITSLPDKGKRFNIDLLRKYNTDVFGAVIMMGWNIIGVVSGINNSNENKLYGISAEVLLREMCQYKYDIENAIAEGRLQDEPMPNFIIHSGVLEKYCGSEENVVVPDGVHTIGKNAFEDNWIIRCVRLPNSVLQIEDGAFASCLLLQKVSLSDNIKTISNRAFEMCRSLESIELPDSVTKVGWFSFAYCDNLKSVQLSEKLEHIENYAFTQCISLESIRIPNTVKSIGEHAFGSCKKLLQIELPNSVNVDLETFEDTPWLKKHLKEIKEELVDLACPNVEDNLKEQ